MVKILIFASLSIPIVIISWRTLFNIKSHGFYRFFSWECIVWLFAANCRVWFDDPFTIKQIFSWTFLIISIYLMTAGVIFMIKMGKPDKNRKNKTLFQFEQTTELVDKGIYQYIRHPLYSSLLFLTLGIFLKNLTLELLIVTILSTVFVCLTAITDEKECVIFFGDKYTEYMKRSKRFIPYII
jgi:protein-S-isoprenylcysteine O-methyltransferase Ste14